MLNEQLACSKGVLFQAVALDADEIDARTANGEMDFLFNDPSAFACSMAAYGVRPIASLVNNVAVNGAGRAAISGGAGNALRARCMRTQNQQPRPPETTAAQETKS